MYVAFSLSICMYIYQDKFIRRWYYGGHTDVYIPYGENLHYYDANSLYPFAMLWDMREGNPKWVSNERIDDEKDFIQLKDLFGFIQAFIVELCSIH